MEVRAIAKSVRISPRKMRLVADAIRNMPIEKAYRVLEVTEQKASGPIQKTLKSAVANAVTNANLSTKNLYISSIMVNEGQVLKRFRPSTRGRIHPYKKRGSHLTIVLKEKVVSTVAAATQKAVEDDVIASTAPTPSQRADQAVEAALYGGTEEKKQGGVKGLAARLTGRKKTEKKETKKEDKK
jgi:large subunit ribosomal protein L22